MFKLKCEQCGCEFEHSHTRKRFCDECIKNRKRESTKRIANERKSSKIKVAKPVRTLTQVTAELKAYNKEHKTNLNYGEFVKMKGW
jgi:hypothetical protein